MPPVSEDIEYVTAIAAKALTALQDLAASLGYLSDDPRLSDNERRALRHQHASVGAMMAKTDTIWGDLSAMYEKAAWKEGEIQ